MAAAIATVVVGVFAILSLIHLYWAAGGRAGKAAAVPHVSGRPAFVPSPIATLAVAAGLAVCALLVASTARFIASPVPAILLKWLCFALAGGLFLRAVGDFRLVGFFKRTGGSAFARLDTLVFSPLCLVLAIGVFYVAMSFAG